MKKYIYMLAVLVAFSCNEAIDYSLEGESPAPPEFTIDEVPGDPNSFVVTDRSDGNFSRVWELRGGAPLTSTLVSDTVFYSKQGSYEIRLNVASSTGGGTSFNTKTVTVANDVLGCQLPFLNEECTTTCWRLSGEEAGVMVGPIPYSGEWYTSPDIVPTQADDRWCFSEDGNLEYNNSGSSFSACQGFVEVTDYPIPPEIVWDFDLDAGIDGHDRITIDGIWMGVEDTGPTYDIVEVDDDTMVLLAPIKPCDGSPSPGWFTLTFFKAE